MNVLLTGVSGYVGSRLLTRLLRDGHDVRGFVRRERDLGIPLVTGDAITGRGLDEALSDIDVAYFLIHSMEHSNDGPFNERERRAAENFAQAARKAGVRRIIYLGGLLPEGGPASVHLSSRFEVENILRDAAPCTISFRASIVIGAHSRSFRFLVRLVERLPVLAVPAWGPNRTAPIDERDMVELLVRAGTGEATDLCGQSLDIGGPDVISYGELIDRIRHHMFVSRPTLRFSRLTVTPIASVIGAAIAGEDADLIGPLMESLGDDLIPRDRQAADALGVRLHSLDSAIEHSLREWEENEPLAAR
jgi:uncharacterized protein YbjT (DUF2867 family)